MKKSLLPAALGALALLIGAGAMSAMMLAKKPPAEASVEEKEKPILVEVLEAQPVSVPVTLTGHGEIRPVREAQIAAEVAGRIVRVHPDFEVGRSVPEGAVLFAVDPVLYEMQVNEARAAVAQAEASLRRLSAESDHNRQRLGTLDRRASLAASQYKRAQQLVEEGIGTETERENAEQNHIAVRQERDQAKHTLDLIPIQLDQAQRDLELAQSRLETAELNLARTKVTAPFAGRIKTLTVEQGQYVRPGEASLTLADDSVLELPLQLDGREASQWLRFSDADRDAGWFGALEPAVCEVAWTESPESTLYEGILDRVESFDPESRMLTVVVRIDPAADSGPFLLVEGMFCRAEIPGRDLEDIYQLPKTAVTFDNTVYISAESRLKTVPVDVARIDDQYAYVSGGIAPGDQIVTTRLVNPLDHSLLEIVEPKPEAS